MPLGKQAPRTRYRNPHIKEIQAMRNLFLLFIAGLFSCAAMAQNEQPSTPAEIKAQGKVDQATIKANNKVGKALNKEAQANVDADAHANKKKLDAHRKTEKTVNDAAADIAKQQNKAELEAAKASR
jgi:hypothetical protein